MLTKFQDHRKNRTLKTVVGTENTTAENEDSSKRVKLSIGLLA